MDMLNMAIRGLMLTAMIVLAIAVIFCLLRAILGPRFTDRLIAVNLVGTKTIILICVVAIYIGEQYVVDVALIYALISFLAVVVLTNVYKSSYNKRKAEKEQKTGKEESLYGTWMDSFWHCGCSDSGWSVCNRRCNLWCVPF